MQYGTVVFWGISAADEHAVLESVVSPCKQDPFQPSEIEIDEFTFHYSMYEPPHIQNDVITINRQYAADHQVRFEGGCWELPWGRAEGSCTFIRTFIHRKGRRWIICL